MHDFISSAGLGKPFLDSFDLECMHLSGSYSTCTVKCSTLSSPTVFIDFSHGRPHRPWS
jgi:hypothetical protein